MLRVQSPLPEEVEQLMRATIGCCIAVHRELGPGLRERIYSRAIAIELKAAGIEFEREKKYPVTYRGELLCDQKLDFVVANEIVLEVKSVEHLAAIHHAQIVNYMRIARIRAGLLLNFNVIVLPDGMSRKVL
ncbi:MAG TPA: GxxExxY protein [Vicinamibacterales bacterium]|jgi:GxxExxY protein|nr:GxxExxY protein [Vicinamibacterales bacterium]